MLKYTDIEINASKQRTEVSPLPSSASWPKRTIFDLEDEIANAKEQKRHLFILDKDGGVPTEFEGLGGIHKEFTYEMINVAMSSDNVGDMIDIGLVSLRESLD